MVHCFRQFAAGEIFVSEFCWKRSCLSYSAAAREMLADRQQGLEFAQEPTMTTDAAMSLKGLVEEGPDADMLREAIASTAERLIELEVSPTYVKRLSPRKRVFR